VSVRPSEWQHNGTCKQVYAQKGINMTTIRKREKENRRDRRQEKNLLLEYQHNEFDINDISLGGLSISAETTVFSELQEIEATIKHRDNLIDMNKITLPMIVKRINSETNETAFQFQALNDEQFSILETYLTGRAISKKSPII
jgi:hypothetical protein